MDADAAGLVVVGRITTVFGVKGWVKVHSYTEPMENILGYRSWYVERKDGQKGEWQPIEIEDAKRHQKGLIALIEGVSDREQARSYCQCDIAVPEREMPELEQGDFYWHQLEGLKVYSCDAEGRELLLGKVDHLMETGANDVVVVKACEGSIDQRERLIPWLPDQVIKQVDIDGGAIRVDWDSEF